MSRDPPSDTTLENPTLLGRAQSSMAVQTAPDCDTSPSEPASALPLANVAFSPRSGRMMPRQLGPTTRTWCRRALSSAARSSRAPAAPVSPNPAVMITAARTPASPHSIITCGTVSGGVAITARSTRWGTFSMLGKHGMPWTLRCFGFTANNAPRYPAARMFCTRTEPTAPARALAPMIATDVGSNNGVR